MPVIVSLRDFLQPRKESLNPKIGQEKLLTYKHTHTQEQRIKTYRTISNDLLNM